MIEKICDNCKLSKEANNSNFYQKHGNLSNICIICHNLKGRLNHYKKLGFDSEEKYLENLAYLESLKLKNVSVIYEIWLGEKGLFYIGQTKNYYSREGEWRSHLVGNKRINSFGSVINMKSVYNRTKIFQIKPIVFVKENDNIDLLERQCIINYLLKYKDVYNKLI